MTTEELERLFNLKVQQRRIKKRLKEVRAESTSIHSARLDGMPKSPRRMDSALERTAITLVHFQEQIINLESEIVQEEMKLWQYINTIPDSKIRQIMAYRHIYCMRWGEIAEEMEITEGDVKMSYQRFRFPVEKPKTRVYRA